MPVRKRSGSSRNNSSRRRSNGRSNSATDAIAFLKQDHATVKKLLKRLESAEDGSERQELLSQVEMEVKIHTQIEEDIFYPAYRESARSEKDEELYFEALEEHHVVDLILPEIKNVDSEDERFAAKAKVLKDVIEHHIEEEEKQLFPKARRLLGMSMLKELGDQLEQRKQELASDYGTDAPRGRRRRAA